MPKTRMACFFVSQCTSVEVQDSVSCVEQTDAWMSRTRTVAVAVARRMPTNRPAESCFFADHSQFLSTVTDLGVVSDGQLSMSDHVPHITQSGMLTFNSASSIVQ